MRERTFVILGGSGDLSRRLLIPGIAEYQAIHPDEEISIVGVGHEPEDDYHGVVRDSLEGVEAGAALAERATWITADATDPEQLKPIVEGLKDGIVYFALSPAIATQAVDALSGATIASGVTLAMEKPFGTDVESARALNKKLLALVPEEQIFRVDHFLAMAATVNVTTMRQTNRMLEAIWSAEHIGRVDVVFDEILGLEGRAEFYDSTGAANDMIQSHLLQVLGRTLASCDACMEDSASILRATTVSTQVEEPIKRGRYTAGSVEGREFPSYTDEEGVDPSKETETWAEVTLDVATDRWDGIPIVVRSGKAIGNPRQEIIVTLRDASGFRGASMAPNIIRLEFEDDDIYIEMNAADYAQPGTVSRVTLNSRLHPRMLGAYGRVVHAVLTRDMDLSVQADAAVEGWRIMEPINEAFASGDVPLIAYPAGTQEPGNL